MTGTGMDYHSLRLVYNQQLIVFIKNVQRNIFRFDIRLLILREKNHNLNILRHLQTGFGRFSIDSNIAFFKLFLCFIIL